MQGEAVYYQRGDGAQPGRARAPALCADQLQYFAVGEGGRTDGVKRQAGENGTGSSYLAAPAGYLSTTKGTWSWPAPRDGLLKLPACRARRLAINEPFKCPRHRRHEG